MGASRRRFDGRYLSAVCRLRGRRDPLGPPVRHDHPRSWSGRLPVVFGGRGCAGCARPVAGFSSAAQGFRSAVRRSSSGGRRCGDVAAGRPYDRAAPGAGL